jgi:hypothetical protein
MDKRGSDLSKEVKILQEALADYNTVLDKVGGGARARLMATAVAAPPPNAQGCGRLTSRRDDTSVCVQVGSQAPVYVIQQEMTGLRDRNEQQRKRVDEVLTERLNLEAKTKQVRARAGAAGHAAHMQHGCRGDSVTSMALWLLSDQCSNSMQRGRQAMWRAARAAQLPRLHPQALRPPMACHPA